MTFDDKMTPSLPDPGKAKRMRIVLAEEIPQMDLDTGVSTQRGAELPMLFALVLTVGCREIALAMQTSVPDARAAFTMLRASVVDNARRLKLPTGKFDISIFQKET